jgi:hypothetical protein
VQRALTPDQIQRVQADDGSVRKQVRENVERDAIVRVVEGGDDDRAVRDVEVGVAGRQAKSRWQHL